MVCTTMRGFSDPGKVDYHCFNIDIGLISYLLTGEETNTDIS